MRNFIIAIWLIFAAFFVFPMVTNYSSGSPESEVVSIIEKEAETDDIQITSVEEHGNKAMYAFNTDNTFGVAIFNKFADNYKYSEGTISNEFEDIDVYLDTGWDVYRYKVTDKGAEQVGFERFAGVYKIYSIIAVIMVIVSIRAGIYGVRQKKKHEEQRRKGLRQ